MSDMQEDICTGNPGEAHWHLPKNADSKEEYFRFFADAEGRDRIGKVYASATADVNPSWPSQMAGQSSFSTAAGMVFRDRQNSMQIQ